MSFDGSTGTRSTDASRKIIVLRLVTPAFKPMTHMNDAAIKGVVDKENFPSTSKEITHGASKPLKYKLELTLLHAADAFEDTVASIDDITIANIVKFHHEIQGQLRLRATTARLREQKEQLQQRLTKMGKEVTGLETRGTESNKRVDALIDADLSTLGYNFPQIRDTIACLRELADFVADQPIAEAILSTAHKGVASIQISLLTDLLPPQIQITHESEVTTVTAVQDAEIKAAGDDEIKAAGATMIKDAKIKELEAQVRAYEESKQSVRSEGALTHIATAEPHLRAQPEAPAKTAEAPTAMEEEQEGLLRKRALVSQSTAAAVAETARGKSSTQEGSPKRQLECTDTNQVVKRAKTTDTAMPASETAATAEPMQPLVETAIADATMEHPHSDDKFVSIKLPSSTDNIANDAMAVNGKLRVGVLGLVDAYNQTVDAHSENETKTRATKQRAFTCSTTALRCTWHAPCSRTRTRLHQLTSSSSS
jgi:hypothetical protein